MDFWELSKSLEEGKKLQITHKYFLVVGSVSYTSKRCII